MAFEYSNKKSLLNLNLSRLIKDGDRTQSRYNRYFADLDSIEESLVKQKHQLSCDVKLSDYSKLLVYDSDVINENNLWKKQQVIIEEPELHINCNLWHELYHRIQVITETHSSFLFIDGSFQSAIHDLNERLRRLRLELRKTQSRRILEEIRELVSEMRRLATRSFWELKYKYRAFPKKLFSFKRNLRFTYRQIVRFLFKNMDDESGYVNNVATAIAVYAPLLTFKNRIYNGKRQTKMDRYNNCYP